jgi:hypothetical protein
LRLERLAMDARRERELQRDNLRLAGESTDPLYVANASRWARLHYEEAERIESEMAVLLISRLFARNLISRLAQ